MSLINVHHARFDEEAVTMRPPSTAIFAVDSDDRYKTYQERRTSPSFPFSFQITKQEALLNGFFTRLAVSEFRMYWTLPNIHVAWGNNTLTYYESVTPATHTITIPDGFYDLDSLMATIQDLVRADGFIPAFVALSNVDGTSAYATGNPAITFNWVPPTSTIRTLYDMLNLTNASPPVPATTARGGVANLRPTDFIDIVSPQLTYNQDLKDGTTAPYGRDALVRIYLDDPTKSLGRFNTNLFTAVGAPNGFQVPQYDVTSFTNGSTPFTIYRQFPYPKQILWNTKQPLGNISFEMYDDQGRSLQSLWTAVGGATPANQFYANSFVWNMTMLVTEN